MGSQPIPMRELKKVTGLSKATINFYIKEGLLPPPQKTAKNMAYYDEDFIKRLKLVELMRGENYTLAQIKKLLNSDSGTMNDFYVQILDSVNKLMPYSMEDAPVPRQRLKDVGFDDKALDGLIEMKLITPSDKAQTLFPAYSVTVCMICKYFVDIGIPAASIKEIIAKVKELTDIEKKVFVEYIRTPMLDRKFSQEEQRAEVQRCIQNFNTLLPILHLQFIKQLSESLIVE